MSISLGCTEHEGGSKALSFNLIPVINVLALKKFSQFPFHRMRDGGRQRLLPIPRHNSGRIWEFCG